MRDLVVRSAVRSRWRREHVDNRDTRIVEQTSIWKGACVDLAVLNGKFVRYEMKSARDTLAHRPNQTSLYKAVDLVVAKKHLGHAFDE